MKQAVAWNEKGIVFAWSREDYCVLANVITESFRVIYVGRDP